MIKENVKNLFLFIDYLHSNKAYLLSKEDLIDETNRLLQKRNSIRPNENYKSKIEYDNIQLEIAKKFDVVEAEIINPLKEKISELNIADISTPIINLNAQSELFELQRNFEGDDLRLIFETKQKYLDFRNETNFGYYLQFFFFELDRTLKEFYDFFSDNDLNEFSKLQTNVVTVESLDEQGIEKAVRKLTGYSNKLNFETFPEFLDYFKKEVKDVDFDERHSEIKRMLEQQKIKLENSTFQSEIDEVKIFSENAVKDFKHKLMLSFTNENYKTKTVGFMPTHYNYVLGLIEYENLYNSAKNKSDVFNYLSTLSKEEIEERIQGAEVLKRLCEISIDYSKDGNWSVGNLPIEFDAITKVDLFVENFIKSIEILAKDGKDVHQLIDLLIQGTKTDLENPLLEKNVKINNHLLNKLGSVKVLFQNVKVLPIQKDRSKTLISQTERKYIAKEYALAYIFDLYAKGEMIPINAIDGGYNAKQLKQIGLNKGFSSPDTFYRAVKTVLEFDLNKVKDLQSISKDWLNAVEKLSNNWIETQQYLMKQNLIEE